MAGHAHKIEALKTYKPNMIGTRAWVDLEVEPVALSTTGLSTLIDELQGVLKEMLVLEEG